MGSRFLEYGWLRVRHAADCCRRIGVPVRFRSTGGGSDANNFNIHGIRSTAAVIGMENPHTTEEQITLANLCSPRAGTDAVKRYSNILRKVPCVPCSRGSRNTTTMINRMARNILLETD